MYGISLTFKSFGAAGATIFAMALLSACGEDQQEQQTTAPETSESTSVLDLATSTAGDFTKNAAEAASEALETAKGETVETLGAAKEKTVEILRDAGSATKEVYEGAEASAQDALLSAGGAIKEQTKKLLED
jgi:hypothetical protein